MHLARVRYPFSLFSPIVLCVFINFLMLTFDRVELVCPCVHIADLMKSHEPWTWTNPFLDDPFHKIEEFWEAGPLHVPTHEEDENESPESPATACDAPSVPEATLMNGTRTSANTRKEGWAKRVRRGIRYVGSGLKKIGNPPLVGGLTGVFCGIIPLSHKWLFEQGWLSP